MAKTIDSGLTDEQIKRIRHQADMATCCLNMVTLHVMTITGAKFCVSAYPWDCLEAAANLAKLGDVIRVFATHSQLPSGEWWSWERRTPKARKVILTAIMAA